MERAIDMALGKSCRKDFPIFSRKVNNKRLAYLDSAATSQKPKCVLEAEAGFYKKTNGNPSRGVSTLTTEAGEAYEKARARVAKFIHAKAEEIIFTRNTTESLNLLSYVLPSALAKDISRPIALSQMEHHSNFVPWQQMAQRTGRRMAFVPFDTHAPMGGENLETLARSPPSVLSSPPSLLTLSHASNAIGTIADARGMAGYAHENWDCPVVVDAAQSAPPSSS